MYMQVRIKMYIYKLSITDPPPSAGLYCFFGVEAAHASLDRWVVGSSDCWIIGLWDRGLSDRPSPPSWRCVWAR